LAEVGRVIYYKGNPSQQVRPNPVRGVIWELIMQGLAMQILTTSARTAGEVPKAFGCIHMPAITDEPPDEIDQIGHEPHRCVERREV
jgi:hypothetical protein